MIKHISALLLLLLIGLLSVSVVYAQQPGDPRASLTTKGTGTHFEIEGNSFNADNITVDTNLVVTMRLQGVSDKVTFDISQPTTGTVTFTVSGLEPSTTYYLYEGDYTYYDVLQSDALGQLSYSHDLAETDYLWLSHQYGPTPLFVLDATGGDCVAPNGTFSAGTCTLSADLTETVQINDPDLTLDCSGHSITPGPGVDGIFLPVGSDRVTIKNCDITQIDMFAAGIGVRSNDNTITSNDVLSEWDGITLRGGTGTTVSFNNITGQVSSSTNFFFGGRLLAFGVTVFGGGSEFTITSNTFSSNNVGISVENGPRVAEGGMREGYGFPSPKQKVLRYPHEAYPGASPLEQWCG